MAMNQESWLTPSVISPRSACASRFQRHSVGTTNTLVSVRETSKMDGEWVAIDRLREDYDRLETWSQIVYDSYLCAQMPGGHHHGAAG